MRGKKQLTKGKPIIHQFKNLKLEKLNDIVITQVARIDDNVSKIFDKLSAMQLQQIRNKKIE